MGAAVARVQQNSYYAALIGPWPMARLLARWARLLAVSPVVFYGQLLRLAATGYVTHG